MRRLLVAFSAFAALMTARGQHGFESRMRLRRSKSARCAGMTTSIGFSRSPEVFGPRPSKSGAAAAEALPAVPGGGRTAWRRLVGSFVLIPAKSTMPSTRSPGSGEFSGQPLADAHASHAHLANAANCPLHTAQASEERRPLGRALLDEVLDGVALVDDVVALFPLHDLFDGFVFVPRHDGEAISLGADVLVFREAHLHATITAVRIPALALELEQMADVRPSRLGVESPDPVVHGSQERLVSGLKLVPPLHASDPTTWTAGEERLRSARAMAASLRRSRCSIRS